jgi:hypothetical protein
MAAPVGSPQYSQAKLLECKTVIEQLIADGFLTSPATKVVGSSDSTASSLLIFLKKAIAGQVWLDTAQT